MTTNRLIL